MSSLAPPAVVNGPAPAPPVHSLRASVGGATIEANERWQAGFSWLPEACATPGLWDPHCTAGQVPGNAVQKSDPPAKPTIQTYDPFVIETAFECNPVGRDSIDFTGRALRQLEAVTDKGLEQEFWTGGLKPTNPHLAQASATVLNGGVAYATATRGLAALVQALSDCAGGGRGMIHVRPELAVYWNLRLKADGQKLLTTVGNHIVVPGVGYPGTSKTGGAPGAGATWAFASGIVQVRLSDPVRIGDELDGLDRATNTLTVRAERMASAIFDPCCLFAAQITLA